MLEYNDLSRIVTEKLISVQNANPELAELLNIIGKSGSVIIFGGSVRDFILENEPRDYDFVIDTKYDLNNILSNYNYSRNNFGGFKVQIGNDRIDIWALRDTWAFKNKILRASIKDLTKTVFFNIDSIAYDISNGQLYDDGFMEAIQTKQLRIILKENPFPELCVLRSFVLSKKYDLIISVDLEDYIRLWLKTDSNPLETLCKMQKKHYNKMILSENTLTVLIQQYL